MADALEFPRLLLREQTGAWQIVSSTVSPGQSASGVFGRTRMDGGGIWRAEYGAVNLRTPDHVRAWRALEVLADGGVVPLVVPMCDKRQMPAPVVDGKRVVSFGRIPHSDAAYFSDGSGYVQHVVNVVAFSAAALRATTMVVQMSAGSPFRGGEMFSVKHPTMGWRAYKIGSVQIDDVGVSTIKFGPPLREQVQSGERLNFDDICCTMMLAEPNAMKLAMSMRRFANPDVAFIEYPAAP